MTVNSNEIVEITKVGLIGGGGTFASLTIADITPVVSLLVALATLTYIVLKTVLMVKAHNKGKDPVDD